MFLHVDQKSQCRRHLVPLKHQITCSAQTETGIDTVSLLIEPRETCLEVEASPWIAFSVCYNLGSLK